GILNLAGTAVPVLRLDRLFGLPAAAPHAYQHLVLLQGTPALALLVDRARTVVTVPADRVAPVGEGETYNGCVVGQITLEGTAIQLLSAGRLLTERERQAVAAFQAMHETRLEGLGQMP
ncbi:MAG: chemotaxis protein CheW, partial [Rhodospirillaceae bacterium]|nr:chemotaxis protein CheW [Rhodospirillaceae bacterium]